MGNWLTVAFDLDDEIEAFFRRQPLAERGDVPAYMQKTGELIGGGISTGKNYCVPGINDYMKNPLKMLSLQGV